MLRKAGKTYFAFFSQAMMEVVMIMSLSLLATTALAVVAGFGYISFWWCLIPAFLTGSFMITNHEGALNALERAEAKRNILLFPLFLCGATGAAILFAAAIFGITTGIIYGIGTIF